MRKIKHLVTTVLAVGTLVTVSPVVANAAVAHSGNTYSAVLQEPQPAS
ncbi:hypothetical protein [Alicyclobacillus acidocaldarius]|uniref:Uncharacterized protein n=1 Tax=Alicyclobacillus acidocaldarius (strain Tc-4-1) TaxID=1048834 RepID=F8II11_ALIAT|nr:hypothetical protein [Alicyclobacillus acidocaldarius]AEJ44491.1 hypothetical protein TC41_2596 [Alicyclobacillus acidocaldarius subsp. acidocaldarius Tc-4-1]